MKEQELKTRKAQLQERLIELMAKYDEINREAELITQEIIDIGEGT